MLHNKKKFIFIFVLMILLIIAFGVYKGFFLPSKNVLTATGTIEATSVNITARLPGPITNIYFSDGDMVKKNDLVSIQERNDLKAQRERDALTLLKSEMTLKDLLSGAQIQEIESAQSAVDTALEKAKDAEADYLRYKALYEQGVSSKTVYEKYKTQYEISKNALQSAQAKLSLIKSGTRNAQIDAAQAEVDRSKAILKASDAVLSDLKLYSPISGRVVSKNYEEGEYVQPGASIITIANLENLWIKVYVPTDDLPKIKLDQTVSFTVSGIDTLFQGTIVHIADKGEFTPKTIQTKKERTNIVFEVKIKINSNQGILKPGMPADVVFEEIEQASLAD